MLSVELQRMIASRLEDANLVGKLLFVENPKPRDLALLAPFHLSKESATEREFA